MFSFEGLVSLKAINGEKIRVDDRPGSPHPYFNMFAGCPYLNMLFDAAVK